jgi:hypothetical protein
MRSLPRASRTSSLTGPDYWASSGNRSWRCSLLPSQTAVAFAGCVSACRPLPHQTFIAKGTFGHVPVFHPARA